jgi:hypothetical protein
MRAKNYASKSYRKNRIAKNHTMKTLPDDYDRCDGFSYIEDGKLNWREGCENCLRRIAPRPDPCWMMSPPPIIAFECEFLIEE